MLDLFLNWFVIAIPLLVTVGATVLALKIPHERHYWKFVTGAFVVGLVFSGLTYWQQVRVARQATKDRDAAIRETSTEVARETTENITKAIGEQYKGIIASLTQQVGDLKGQLATQGKKVDAISSSNIVTGKKPIPVEVTNGSAPAASAAQVENLRMSWERETSTHSDAPYAEKVTIQSDAPVNPIKLLIFCTAPLKYAELKIADVTLYETSSTISKKDDHVYIVSLSSLGTPILRPDAPLVVHLYSDQPLNVSRGARGPR